MSLGSSRLPAIAALLLVSAALLSACGGDDDSVSGNQAGQVETQAQEESSDQDYGATGPASANDNRPEAPDDAISDRPGGPNDKSDDARPARDGKQGGNASEGSSVQRVPVSPASP